MIHIQDWLHSHELGGEDFMSFFRKYSTVGHQAAFSPQLSFPRFRPLLASLPSSPFPPGGLATPIHPHPFPRILISRLQESTRTMGRPEALKARWRSAWSLPDVITASSASASLRHSTAEASATLRHTTTKSARHTAAKTPSWHAAAWKTFERHSLCR